MSPIIVDFGSWLQKQKAMMKTDCDDASYVKYLVRLAVATTAIFDVVNSLLCCETCRLFGATCMATNWLCYYPTFINEPRINWDFTMLLFKNPSKDYIDRQKVGKMWWTHHAHSIWSYVLFDRWLHYQEMKYLQRQTFIMVMNMENRQNKINMRRTQSPVLVWIRSESIIG